jgi:NhaP-type Na+/H+ or K+/H+ antiporter
MSGSNGPLLLALMAGAILAWSVLSVRLERWRISAAMLFVAVGAVATNGSWRLVDISLHSRMLESVAELALAMVLFTDASRVNVHRLRRDAAVPIRLLAAGLPLAVVIGVAAAALVFNGIDIWMALLVAVIVAPTDAALGAPVIENPHVPTRIRRALNVESGLNDGLATPIFTIALALAVSHGDGHGAGVATEVAAVAGGLGIGLAGGVIGGWLLRVTEARGWATSSLQPVAVIALPLLIYGLALLWGLNGFVAAFVAGISFGATWHPSESEHFDIAVSLAADVGGVLSAAVWLMAGAMLVPVLEDVDWRAIVFAVLALTVVRGIAVAMALAGAGLDRATVAFMAWFGPRGLASVVFALIAYDELAPSDAKFVLTAVVTVVVLSVIAHGVTAGPLAERFGRSHPDPEGDATPALPSRSFGRRRIFSEPG